MVEVPGDRLAAEVEEEVGPAVVEVLVAAVQAVVGNFFCNERKYLNVNIT